MFNDNPVNARRTRFKWSTNEFECTVLIGDEGTDFVVRNGSRSWHATNFCKRNQIANHRQIGNRGGIGCKAQLSGHIDGRCTFSVPNQRRDGLIDNFNFLSSRARIKSNPAEVSVSIGAVLLEADFTPCCAILWEHGIAVSIPGSSGKSTHIACWQSSKPCHGDENGIEFITGAFLDSLDKNHAQVFGVRNA